MYLLIENLLAYTAEGIRMNPLKKCPVRKMFAIIYKTNYTGRHSFREISLRLTNLKKSAFIIFINLQKIWHDTLSVSVIDPN